DDVEMKPGIVDVSAAEIAHQRLAQTAHAHQRYGDVAIEVQNAPQLVAQSFHVIADALLAELAEPRQVLPDEGRADAGFLPELLRRHEFLVAVSRRFLKHTQVNRKPAHDRT